MNNPYAFNKLWQNMLRFLFFLYGKYSNLFREQMLVQMCMT